MKKIIQEACWFFRQKQYTIALSLTAACCYGYAVTHASIGIDDTAIGLYLDQGLLVVMGRWTVFLLNKVFRVSPFAPYMLELVGVLLFMAAVTLFCVFLRRIFGERAGIWGYTAFACVFLSNPIISEVYVYYYHNGIEIGYILTALALILFMEGTERGGRKSIWRFLGSMLLLWQAVGCYESFLILYMLGILVILFLRGIVCGETLKTSYVMRNLGIGALLTAGSVLLRTVTIPCLIALFGLQELVGLQELRSPLQGLALFGSREGLEELVMLLKRYWVVYHVNAFVYLPVTGYVGALAVTGITALAASIRKRNLWYLFLHGGMTAVPFLLTVVQGRVTSYRSCQFLPFFTAFSCLLLYNTFSKGKYIRFWRPAAAVLLLILVYNQAESMNRSFYTDHLKYERTKEILTQIAREVESRYGTELPVIFTGHYEEPYEFRKDYCVAYTSWQYRAVAGITDLVDVHLKEKYFSPEGYSFVGEALNPFIQWGLDAFDGTNREIIRFLEMHGHELRTVTDPEVIEAAGELGETMPEWPAEGSVTQQDGYILIHM